MIIIILATLSYGISASLRPCPVDVELINIENDTETKSQDLCIEEMKFLAAQRHVFYIRPFETSDVISMPCDPCSNDTDDIPVWYFVHRNVFPLVGYDYKNIAGNYVILLQTGTVVKNNEIYCLTAKNSLRIKSFDPDKVLGTYYCDGGNSSILKYIWHHVDTFYLPDDPNHAKKVVGYVALKSGEVKSYLNDIEDELKRLYPTLIYESNLIKLFYDFLPKPSSKGLCGDLNLKYIRQCYIQIPRNVSESSPLTDAEYAIYYALLQATKPITDYKSMSEDRDGRMYVAAKMKAVNIADSLGFMLNFKVEDIVIPCHFSFLKHLEAVPKMRNPFGIFSPYGMVSVNVKCPEINPMDIIKLAMARDIGQLKMKILGEVQKSMRSVDKLYLQGSLNEKLICGFAKLSGDVCTNRRLDVQWRKGNFVFNIQSVVKQRVYILSNCQLFFSEMRLRDRGTYHCFRKSSDKKSWSVSPTTKFLIQVERSKNPIPKMKDVLKYFMILFFWTAFIFILWFVLSFINIRIRVNARYRADERKRLFLTQSRRRNSTLSMHRSIDNASKMFEEEQDQGEIDIDKKID